MSRASIAVLSFVAGLMFADWTHPEPKPAIPASSGATVERPKRPCGGLWVRHEEARFRGPVHCTPSADLTKRRPLPRHILTSPLLKENQ